MIVAAAVVPQTPALLPGVTGGPIAEIEQLRAHCTAAVQWVLASSPDLVVAVAAYDEAASGFRGEPADRQAPALGHAVLLSLLPDDAEVTLVTVAPDATAEQAAELGAQLAARAKRVGLLVAGDSSARRSLKAPGYYDARAAGFDAVAERAFATGDAAALLALDPGEAADLLVAGRAAWQVLAGAMADPTTGAAAGPTTGAAAGPSIRAQLDFAADPFGVRYVVARWSPDLGAPTRDAAQ